MDSDPQSALGHINRGIDAHEGGNYESAKRHFAQALSLEPNNEIGWLWLTEASTEPSEKLYCLNRAFSINPDSKGRSLRGTLSEGGTKPIVPSVIRDLENPPIPPSFRRNAPTRAISLRFPVARGVFKRITSTPSTNPKEAGTTSGDGPGTKRAVRKSWPRWLAAGLVVLAIAAFLIFQIGSNDNNRIYIAVAGPMSGDDASIGLEMQRGAQIAANDFNRTTPGAKIDLLFFDDHNDPGTAETVANVIVGDNRIIGVVGHGTSSTSLAAAPIYEAARIPAISAQATSNSLADYPDYFRTIFSDKTEATILASYVNDVFEQDTVTIVTGESGYEQSLTEQFVSGFANKDGKIKATLTISDADVEGSVQSAIDSLSLDSNPGMVFLALTERHGHDFVLAMRRAGLDPAILGSEALGSTRFADLFNNEPEEQQTPGYFTENMYAVSPLIYDSVGADSVLFSNNYREAHGIDPSWRPARVWDAVTAMATGSIRANTSTGSEDMAAKRDGVIAALHAMNDVETSFRGLSGSFFFTETGDSPQGVSMGQFLNGRFSSVPTQYRLVTNTTQYDMAEEVSSGRAIELDGYFVRQYRVAYVGVEMIELRDLNTASQSYKADFFIYFRYNGDDAPLDLVFTNSADGGLSLGEPISESVTNTGMNYKLFRVQGVFDEPMDFTDYPWDRHALIVRFQNPKLKQTDLVYVPDPYVINLTQDQRLVSGLDQSRSFNRIPSWNVTNILYTQASITSSAEDYDTEGLVQYSEFRIVMDTGRDVNSFLAKNLLPLMLLTLVTYIAIWFPAEQAGVRIGFAITALLSSSVMLDAISNQLPDIGYTVAIEWGYYVYIGLSALLVLLTIAVDRSFKAKRITRAHNIDTFIRIAYPLAIAATVAAYWWNYHS